MQKTYDAALVERRIYEEWERRGAFRAGAGAPAGAPPFCIVLPPPNITGSLHMGHAFDHTLPDILIRFARMQGRNVLWQPGTDHAGISTQMVVERNLAASGEPDRRTLGRAEFTRRVWAWKARSGGEIVDQLKRLGASCDWSRERFTLDQGLSAAVIETFVRLHRDGLIYKDKRLVNWDPQLVTAISDIEVENREVSGQLWHLRYRLEAEPERSIVVATTRPETMLGDTAIAVHPDDERYRSLVGTYAILPLVGRRLPIVADPHADPEAGSGAVKITPAHDFNDYEVGQRHDLPQISIFDAHAKLDLADNESFADGLEAGAATDDSLLDQLHGLDRYEARRLVIEALQQQGLVERIEDLVHTVPHGAKSGVAIEPRLTDQWYVDAATLARKAISAVEEGRTQFVPGNWTATYYDWLRNIKPWCISRQLWWGHRIPAWYGPDGKIFVAPDVGRARQAAAGHYGVAVSEIGTDDGMGEAHKGDGTPRTARAPGMAHTYVLRRDEDVLDTWFSSALWPFSTLGWPDDSDEIKTYFPTSILVTGFDIIFFWVARMMMMSLYIMDDVPFRTVYVHALVRDAAGRKMSKSEGNVVNPLELIDIYGADALRFALVTQAAQGRDVRISAERVAGYRNFLTKIWNAARFIAMNGAAPHAHCRPQDCRLTINRWILSELGSCAEGVAQDLENYRFNDAANRAYKFTWNVFCDWYLELAKPVLHGDNASEADECRAVSARCLITIVKILHPFVPFVTEEIFGALAVRSAPPQGRAHEAGGASRASDKPGLVAGPGGGEAANAGAGDGGHMLIHEAWPEETFRDAAACGEIDWLTRLIGQIRSVRAEMNVPAAERVELVIVTPDEQCRMRVQAHRSRLVRMARLCDVRFADAIPPKSAQILIDGLNYCLPLEGLIDAGREQARLLRDIEKLRKEQGQVEKKLENRRFLDNAPAHIVEAQRIRHDDLASQIGRLEGAVDKLAQIMS